MELETDLNELNYKTIKTTEIISKKQELEFTWRIINFTSINETVTTDENNILWDYESKLRATIRTGYSDKTKSVWILQMFGNHCLRKQVYDSLTRTKSYCTIANCVSFHMEKEKMSKQIQDMNGSLSLLTSKGQRINSKKFENYRFQVLENFISRDFLLQNSERLLPNDTFTVVLNMNITYDFEIEELFCVEPEQFKEMRLKKFTSDIHSFYENKSQCDVTIRCRDDADLQAHKLILSARSPVFAKMFEHKMAESQTNLILVEDIDSDVMEQFLKYLYGQDLEVFSPNMWSCLFVVADKYENLDLKSYCSFMMSRHLNVDNIYDVALLADTYNDLKLFSSIKKFVKGHSTKFLVDKNWLNFTLEHSEVAERLISDD